MYKVMFVQDNMWRTLELSKKQFPTKKDAAVFVKEMFNNTFIRSVTEVNDKA